jgi:cardiolipin synthase A/B
LLAVDVRVLTGGLCTDVPVVRRAGHASHEELLGAGVRIYEWKPSTLHAKTFVMDGEWSTVGSMNFDNRSLALNNESTMMVLDAALGQRMNEIFLTDLHDAEEITLAHFRRRPRLERFAERAASLISRLL